MRLYALLLCACPLIARQDLVTCGNHAAQEMEERFLHRQTLRSRHAALQPRLVPRAVMADIGDIAVLEDGDGVVARRNTFNLQTKTLSLSMTAGSYRYALRDGGYDTAAASAGTPLSELGDDDSRQIELPFDFPFFGRSYRRLWVNSDGNLTFDAGDNASVERSLGRAVAGPPRIAPEYNDLDPSLAPDGVRVLEEAGRVVITWVAVPEYETNGLGRPQTFQVKLSPEGNIEFSYLDSTAQQAVVGISPGGSQTSASVVSFTQDPSGTYMGGVLERFTNTDALDIATAAQKFFQNHDDSYDYLVVYNTVDVGACPGSVACENTVRHLQGDTGIGEPVFPSVASEFGSPRRLQAVLNMGRLSWYPVNPAAIVPYTANRADTPVSVIAHEAGHLFLSYASVRDPNIADPKSAAAQPMLGQGLVHWSFNFNSEASLLEGGRIQDNGPNVNPRFKVVQTNEGYAPLDQYLMGFRAPEEVPDTFYVTDTGYPNARPPQAGPVFNGARHDVTIQNLIDAIGRRTPDHTVAQRRFRFAFILVVPASQSPTAAQVAQVETYRREFEAAFPRYAGQRAAADTTLARSLNLSLFPSTGLLTGPAATATLTLAKPATTSVTVVLSGAKGLLELPGQVTIEAGKDQVSFPVKGLRVGVEELTATPSDTRFETLLARIPVAADTRGLQVQNTAGDQQPATAGVPLSGVIEFRVVDANHTPYSAVTVQAAVTEGGRVEPDAANTDALGYVRFRWTPGAAPQNQLRASLPTGASATVVAVSRPVVASGSAVNAASFAPGLTQGAIGTIFGINLAGGRTAAAAQRSQTELAGVQVRLNGRSLPLFYVSDQQANFLVPADATEGNGSLVVVSSAGESAPVPVTVNRFQPGIFFDASTGYGAVLAGGTGQATHQHPVSAGDIVEVYATGLGSGAALARVGDAAAEVLYTGVAPGFPGLQQINVRIPAGLSAGKQTLSLSVNGTRSNEVAIQMR